MWQTVYFSSLSNYILIALHLLYFQNIRVQMVSLVWKDHQESLDKRVMLDLLALKGYLVLQGHRWKKNSDKSDFSWFWEAERFLWANNHPFTFYDRVNLVWLDQREEEEHKGHL